MFYILLIHDLGLKPLFRELIMSLLVSDSLCVILSIVLFSLPRLFPTMYSLVIAPRLVPILLPLGI